MYLLREGGSCSLLISMSKFRSFPHFNSIAFSYFQFRALSFPVHIHSTQFPSLSLSLSPPPLSLCRVSSSGWSLKGGISTFLVSHFHILSVSRCSPVFQIYLDPTFFLVLNCALCLMESGVSLIALHFDWHAKAKPGQQHPHLHAIMLYRHNEISFALFSLSWIIYMSP